jgi:16S rRNA G966 N2-methylase RsmD
MTQDFYKQALFAARIERSKLLDRRKELDAERADIELRMTQLEQTINGLVILSGEQPDTTPKIIAEQLKGLGLADACRVILNSSDRFMTPVRVRNMLEHVKYDFGTQSNPLASIHAILKRFVESGEAEALDVGGKTGYRLKREISKPGLEEIKERVAGATREIVIDVLEREKKGAPMQDATQVDIVLTNPPYSDNKKSRFKKIQNEKAEAAKRERRQGMEDTINKGRGKKE